MLTRDFAFRAAALAASALLHVLLYGALSLAPAWTPVPRMGLVVTDLIVSEPAVPAIQPLRPVTPPRPLARPRPSKSRVESAWADSAATIEPSIQRDVSEPAAASLPTDRAKQTPLTEPTIVTANETARGAIAAQSAPTLPAPEGTSVGGNPLATASSRHDPGPAVAALPPGPPAVAPGALTRTAIPRGGYQITPSYPATARQRGIEGTALLSVFVDADGRVGEVVVKQSAGHPDLDRAAVDAVRRWRFEPARRGTDTVAMWVELPVAFQLR